MKNQLHAANSASLICGRFHLSLDKPLIMGIINLTSDSFSGDGLANDIPKAIDYAYQLIDAGADILDLGAESTRPGAQPASAEAELAVLMPVLNKIINCGRPISVDTNKAEVMASVIAAGVDMVNDIYALRQPGALLAVKDSNCAICLMHMKGEPATMQQQAIYQDVVAEISAFFAQRLLVTSQSGINSQRIILDPGFGFGKTLDHNIQLFHNMKKLALNRYTDHPLPIMIGVSRKNMLGELTGQTIESRKIASISAVIAAIHQGANIVRVHDVAATKDAIAVWQALTK